MKKILSAFTWLFFGSWLSVLSFLPIAHQQSLIATCHAAAIGTWKNYMAYHDITEIEKGGQILYVLASDNLYTYNTNDQSIQTYDKVNGLSDCGISHIAWNNQAKKLVITYSNYNIDLMNAKGEISNVSDYYNKSMTVDKTIYSIDMNGIYAYFSTGFGIVKLNLKDEEFSDTYNLGFRVDYSYIDGDYFYAASSTQGLYRALLTDNLLDKNKWSRVGNYSAQQKTIDPDLLAIAQTLDPGGPKYNCFGFLKFTQGALYTCNGRDLAQAKPGSIQILKDNKWTIIGDESLSNTTGVTFRNIMCMDVDADNDTHLIAGARNGLYEFLNGQLIKFYNNTNSPIESFNNSSMELQLVTGVKFDQSGTIWCLNSQAPTQALLSCSKDGTWTSHRHSELMKINDGGFTNKSLGFMRDITFDSRGLMWFVNNHHIVPSFYCYQPSTDAIRAYTSFINEDYTKVNLYYVRCIEEDKEGNMWLGTDAGPLMLMADDVISGEDILNQVKVPRNDGTNYADYLLAGIDITSIAVDGGNRKWFGTNGAGVFLISSDNMEEIYHFTTDNSDILSNDIEAIAINDQTGEVFFGTNNGLCSYMSDATSPNESMDKDNVYAYPNPVKPDYTGLITVTGLSFNADVKITTSNGVLVAEGKSNGGTFVWDGCDTKGRRVASGVYMVATATSDGQKGTVCKIAVIR